MTVALPVKGISFCSIWQSGQCTVCTLGLLQYWVRVLFAHCGSIKQDDQRIDAKGLGQG